MQSNLWQSPVSKKWYIRLNLKGRFVVAIELAEPRDFAGEPGLAGPYTHKKAIEIRDMIDARAEEINALQGTGEAPRSSGFLFGY